MFVQIIAAAAMMQAAPAAPTEAWTWTLYQGDGPTVLANEIPDTPRLKSTLECANGTGVARITLYNSALVAGFATLTAGAGGDAGTAQAETPRPGVLSVTFRTDHPVFSRFVANGDLSVAVGAASETIHVQRPHLAKLRRFTELCTG